MMSSLLANATFIHSCGQGMHAAGSPLFADHLIPYFTELSQATPGL